MREITWRRSNHTVTMDVDTLRSRLIHAATTYDRRQARGKRYNSFALAQYFMRIDEVMADIEAGATPREALLVAFSDRLLDAMLVEIGEPKFSMDEKRSTDGRWTYQPVKA